MCILCLGKYNSLIICATNRPQDLDAALLSHFDLMIKYNMPDTKTRIAIIQYKDMQNNLLEIQRHCNNLEKYQIICRVVI